MRLRFGAALAILALLCVAAAAPGYRLAPYKDDLFKYPIVLETKDNGDYVVVGYDKQRDLHKRDQVPERQVWWNYVTGVKTTNFKFNGVGTSLKAIGAGKIDGGAKALVIYIHGQGGNRRQGADSGMFGGNFNRIMNLMVQNGGAYISPDFTDIGEAGAADIKSLLMDQVAKSPDAAIFIACGSQGGAICWKLIADPEANAHIAGLLLLGSSHDDAFLKSAIVTSKKARRIPIYIGHGSEDPIFAWSDEAAFYGKVRKAAPGYPIRFVLFQTGVHGTPIRMTDWRLVLNWMLEAGGR